jgi:hypothetical protein
MPSPKTGAPTTSQAAAILLACFTAMGCELITSPDRSMIPDPNSMAPTPDAEESPTTSPDADTMPMPMPGPIDAAAVSDTSTSVDVKGPPDAAASADAGNSPDVMLTVDANIPEPPKSKIIYLTGMPKKANFGGVVGADSLCNLNPPVTGVYKALISDGSTRALGMNWALAPNTKYVRADGTTVIGTTKANATFSFPLTSSMGTQALTIWTGLNADWTTSGDNCSGWTATAGFAANSGLADATDSQAIMGVVENCATLAGAFFACVQQ